MFPQWVLPFTETAYHQLRTAIVTANWRGWYELDLQQRPYPLTAPAVRPATILRCNNRTSTISGTVTITEAAITTPHGSSCCDAPEIWEITTGTVRGRSSVKVSANRNSFQAAMKASSPVVA